MFNDSQQQSEKDNSNIDHTEKPSLSSQLNSLKESTREFEITTKAELIHLNKVINTFVEFQKETRDWQTATTKTLADSFGKTNTLLAMIEERIRKLNDDIDARIALNARGFWLEIAQISARRVSFQYLYSHPRSNNRLTIIHRSCG